MTHRGAGPILAVAPTERNALEPTLKDVIPAVETTWVMVAAILVFLMQAGFLLL